jgi:hypothetical protein
VAQHEGGAAMTKPKKVRAHARPNPNVLRKTVDVVKGGTAPSEDVLLAESYLNSAAMAGSDVRRIQHGKSDDGPGVTELVEELERQTKAVNSGDVSGAERMLFAQAHTLQHLFSRLSRRAIANMEAGSGGVRALHADGSASSKPVPREPRDAGRAQEPASDIRQAGERLPMPPADQQLPRRARGIRAKQTFTGSSL